MLEDRRGLLFSISLGYLFYIFMGAWGDYISINASVSVSNLPKFQLCKLHN